MGFLYFIRGAFTHAGCYAAQVRNYAGLCKCATSLSPSGISVKRYCQGTADRKNVSGQFVCYHLPHRTIVKIQGQETSTFLQGVITNDMGLLVEDPEHSAMYSHMLSVQGRTLYDIMLYRYDACISFVRCFFFFVCASVTTRAWTLISFYREMQLQPYRAYFFHKLEDA